MKKQIKIWMGILLGLAIIMLTGWYLDHHLVAVLQPAGEIGHKERNLIIFCALISVVVVVPVFSMLGFFAWKYREDKPRGRYNPHLEGSAKAETIWWLIPTALMVVISTITWRSSYALDPYKQLSHPGVSTLHVQVVALDWKWLFIYPDQHVASVSQAAIPVDTPVDFEITSDTVMTSFWAPQLGGQMYAMPGMATQLNLQASKTGDYRGVAANISGKGFANMTFTIKALPKTDFTTWVTHTKHTPEPLNARTYADLAHPGIAKKPAYYGSVDPALYDTIMMKYMMPMGNDTNLHGVAN